MTEKDYFGKLINFIGTVPSDFNSEQFYDKLNHGDVNLNEYNSQCDSLITPYRGTIKYARLRRTCAQLVKYLKTPYTTVSIEKPAYNECILLNYWIYSTLVSIFNSDNYSTIFPPLVLLQQIWNNIVYDPSYEFRNNKCTPDGRIITQNDWRDRKALYDYCVNYDSLKKTLEYFDGKCNEYWTYVESHTSLYKYFEKLCSESDSQCPNFYNKCKKYDPRTVLHTFKCHTDMAKKKAQEDSEKAKLELQEGISADQERNSRIPGSSEVSADGNMLRNGFGRNNNNMRNMHGGEYGLFDYASESYNPFTGGSEENYIGYQPA
ncbi:hypothetical protein PVIIG_05861 [Plasmodium vivax India VII]|uniref:Variable surface protein Vir4 n=1 Tax=Plasmodium vivax India VII TaxID=1077284 RepID=A0A0J9S2B9_PLAVI|nr:hypothetical protein PVIIG_05861 [Plasmodium vivax India VII]